MKSRYATGPPRRIQSSQILKEEKVREKNLIKYLESPLAATYACFSGHDKGLIT
jgi:hypothetical protein